MNETGIRVLVDGLQWGTTYHGAGQNPRHIEGTDHFLFSALERTNGKKFLHGQPVGLRALVGSLLHDDAVDQMPDTFARIGLDIRPEAMGLTQHQLEEGLVTLRSFVHEANLWHSIAHDTPITPTFIADLRHRLVQAYAHRN